MKGERQHMMGKMSIQATAPERLFTVEALERAWRALKRAGGGAGMTVADLADFEQQRAQEFVTLRNLLVSGQYRPQPVTVMFRLKASGGLRRLTLWALRDRVAQRAVYDLIGPAFEEIFLPCSFGFRPGRGVPDAVAQVVHYRSEGRRWVVYADIKDCFDEIDQQRLLGLLAEQVHDRLLLHYIRLWLQAKIFRSADGFPKQAGVSQGSALSPLLANIYLHQVDQLLAPTLAYVRYADNVLVCCRRKVEAEAALSQIKQALGRWGLALKPQKTQITPFDRGFAWLGYFFVRNECYRL